MDMREGGCSHPKGVRSQLPSGACASGGADARSLLAKTTAPSRAAGRGGHRTLEREEAALPQKGALKEGRTIVFVDQSGFYLLPAVVRTYAPIGQTPVLHEELSRDHLSAMSGITLEGKLLIIWDGSPIHRAKVVKGFLADGAAARVQLEQLPGYAPELNPDEGIWKHLKCVELKNVCCRSLSELRVEIRKAKERLRHKRDVILGCIRQPGFEV